LTEKGPVDVPVDGILDLHAFHPKDVKSLVPEYLRECRRLGIYQVRIIHGKGMGTLREIIHGILRKNPHVASFRNAHYSGGSWGATEVELWPE